MTTDAFFRQKLANIRTIIAGLRQFDGWLATHPGEDVSAEVAHMHNELNVKFETLYEHLRSQDQMTPQQKAEIEPLLNELTAVLEDLIRKNNTFAGNAGLLIRILNATKGLPATGAGGAGTPAVQQAARMLENLDSIITKQAEQVAQEIKEELSEEARALTLEHAAWIKVAAVIGKLQTINADLITAEQHKDSSVATASLKTALGMLSILGIDLTSIETQIRSALSMNKRAETVAKKAADQLKAIQGQLNIEAARINQARFNNLVT